VANPFSVLGEHARRKSALHVLMIGADSEVTGQTPGGVDIVRRVRPVQKDGEGRRSGWCRTTRIDCARTFAALRPSDTTQQAEDLKIP